MKAAKVMLRRPASATPDPTPAASVHFKRPASATPGPKPAPSVLLKRPASAVVQTKLKFDVKVEQKHLTSTTRKNLHSKIYHHARVIALGAGWKREKALAFARSQGKLVYKQWDAFMSSKRGKK